MVALAVLLIAMIGGLAATASSIGAESKPVVPSRVLVISAPRLTWERFEEVAPPRLTAFFRSSAVAMNSPRTAGSVTGPGAAYLTIGGGNRFAGAPGVEGQVVERGERTGLGDSVEVFARSTGVTPDAPILSLGGPAIERANEEFHFGAQEGALADALRPLGVTVAAIANADEHFAQVEHREAALAAQDSTGQVAAGRVSQELLRAEPGAAFGLELDPTTWTTVFEEKWQPKSVVIAELGDLERAEQMRALATLDQGDRLFREAVRHDDDLVGIMLDRVDLRHDLVIIIGATPPLDGSAMTVFGMAGPGVDKGWASSSGTRRDGYVALTDIAPTIVSALGGKVPKSMNDTRLTSVSNAATLEARVAEMTKQSHRAEVRDEVFGTATVVFIVVLVLTLALAVLSMSRMPRLIPVVRGGTLLVLAAPPASFLLGLVPAAYSNSATLFGSFALASCALAALAACTRRISPIAPPLVLVGLLWLVLAVDGVTGGTLQINTIFGYSPIVAGRFAGFGNQAFSMIAISALLLGSAWVEARTPVGARPDRTTLAAVIAFLGVTVVIDGHPSFGSDVGGVLALVPAATVAVLLFARVKVRVRTVGLIVLGTLSAITVFAMVDLTRDAADQTHLGRFVSKMLHGDAGEIIQRKIEANLRVLTAAWTWVIPIALVYFMYLTWRPTHTLRRLQEAKPQSRAFGISGLVLGVAAMALNDSGASMPAMMLAIGLSYVSYEVLDLESGSDPGGSG
jgi:putative copper export protein